MREKFEVEIDFDTEEKFDKRAATIFEPRKLK